MRLTNREISNTHRDTKFFLMISDFKSSFAYCVNQIDRGDNFLYTSDALKAYTTYLRDLIFKSNHDVKEMSYGDIEKLTSVELFQTISEINILNQLTTEFIDLHALSRNVMYHIMRNSIINDQIIIKPK